MSKCCLTLTIAALLLGACASSTYAAPSPMPSGAQLETLKIGGLERNYYVLRPNNRKGRLPLVLALHGSTQPPQGLELKTKLDGEAAAAGFVVVYPEGISRSWNSSDSGGDMQLSNVDDVGFIRQLIDLMLSTAQIDPKRVFVTGISSGGEMSHRLACELSDRVAAVASVSGDLGVAACNPARPISVLEIHGTADQYVPIDGDPSQNLAPTMSTMQRWARINGCAPDSSVNESGLTKTTTWGGCRSGTTVVLVAITAADHTFWLEGNPGTIPHQQVDLGFLQPHTGAYLTGALTIGSLATAGRPGASEACPEAPSTGLFRARSMSASTPPRRDGQYGEPCRPCESLHS